MNTYTFNFNVTPAATISDKLSPESIDESAKTFTVSTDMTEGEYRNFANRQLETYDVSSQISYSGQAEFDSEYANKQLSYFPGVTAKVPAGSISLEDFYNRILNQPHLPKAMLPLVTVSSSAGRRKVSGQQTGLVCIDCDHFGATMADVDRALECPYAIMAVHSPSLDGIKVVCRVETGAGSSESIFAAMNWLGNFFGLKVFKSAKKGGKCVDRSSLNTVQLTYIPQGRYVAYKAGEVMTAPRMSYTEVDSIEENARIVVPADEIAAEGCGRHASLIAAVAKMAKKGASLEQIKSALPERESDPEEIDRIYAGQQEYKYSAWRGLVRETPFDSFTECCAQVKARFMSQFRVAEDSRTTLYCLDGSEWPAAKTEHLLKLTKNLYRTQMGLSSVSVEAALANTGEYNYMAKRVVDFSKPRGLTENGDINLRAELLFEKESEADVDEELMDQFIKEYDEYFFSRTTKTAKCSDGQSFLEMEMLAAFYAQLCDTADVAHRPCAIFCQGEQGSGKSTVTEDTASVLFGKAARATCQGWMGKSHFTSRGYEKSRVVCIQEASPSSKAAMEEFKQAIRSGMETIEYKGRDPYQIECQHSFLLATNNEFIPQAIIDDRGILIIGMDAVDIQPSELVHDWVSCGLCPWPVALAKRLKEYFMTKGAAARKAILIQKEAPKTDRRDELALNKISDDKWVLTAVRELQRVSKPLSAEELAETLTLLKLECNSRSLGIRLKAAVKTQVILSRKEHNRTGTTTYYSLPEPLSSDNDDVDYPF